MYRAGDEEIQEIAKVIHSKQWFRTGDAAAGHLGEAETFENDWAKKIGTEYAILMSGGGTAALVCSMAGLGIGPGDEVIVPAYTWMATATSVLTVGAIPVLAEIDETMALDPEDLERKIGPNTKAVVPVHMVGRPANMERIMEIARKHGLKVIEDSCQMDGGSFKGKRTGSWGDAGAFSFNFFKIISSGGEGGCMVTSDRKVYERALVYHDSGAAFRPKAGELTEPIFVAQQYRVDEVTAAIARVQMSRLDGILADLRRSQKAVEAGIEKIAGLKLAPCNDREGDCGVTVALQFESQEIAEKFIAASKLLGYLGINHDKHVFSNWKPLIEKRVSHHPDMNPFNFEKNKGLRADYSDEACPKTLDLLRRTFFMGVGPDDSEEVIAGIIKKCQTGAAAI